MSKNKIHHWNSRVKFHDKVKDRKIPGTAKIYLSEPDKFRMDVYEPFGFVRIGTIVVNGDLAKANFINEKPYEGPVTDEALKKIFKMNVSIKDVMGIFTQKGFKANTWDCDVSDQNTLSECQSSLNGVSISWTGPMTSSGNSCRVNHPRAEILFSIKSYEALDKDKGSVFSL